MDHMLKVKEIATTAIRSTEQQPPRIVLNAREPLYVKCTGVANKSCSRIELSI